MTVKTRRRSRPAEQTDWKRILLLQQELAAFSNAEGLRNVICRFAEQFFAATARVWFTMPAYPLPGLREDELLPNVEATALAHRAYNAQTIQYDHNPDELVSAAAPLLSQQAVLAVVQVDRPATHPFTAQDQQHLEMMAAHAGLGMHNALETALKEWHLDQINLIRSISEHIASLAKVDHLFGDLAAHIRDTLNFYYVGIFTFTEQRGTLSFRGSSDPAHHQPLPLDFRIESGVGIIGTVAETGAEIVALDVQNDPRYRKTELLPNTRSEAALPLKVGNRILGVLDVQSDRVNGFHTTDMVVLRALADQIAQAIQNSELYEGLERRAEQISSVFEISHALASILEYDVLLDRLVEVIYDRFGYPYVHVFTVHHGRHMAIYQAGKGPRSETAKAENLSYHLDSATGIIAWVARNGKPIVANDVRNDPLYVPMQIHTDDTRSEMALPLISGNEVLGVLDIQSREVNAFDENEQTLFEALAAPIAVSLRNALLYRSEMWRRQVSESFRDVAHMVSANIPLDQLLDAVLEKLEANLPCDVSAIWLLDDENGSRAPELRLAASRHIPPEGLERISTDPGIRAILESAREWTEPYIRTPHDPLGPLGVVLNFDPQYSSIAAPLRTNNQMLGLLSLAHNQDGRYGSEAKAITATLASNAAVAIQNARLYSESQEQAMISTMLLQVAEASQSIMTVDDLLATMLRMTRLLVGVQTSAFLIWDVTLQHFELTDWHGFDPDRPQPYLISPQFPLIEAIQQTRGIQYTDNPGEELGLPEMGSADQSGIIVAMPLLVRGEVNGIFLVGLQMMASQTTFDPKALAILQGIAHQTAITLENLSLLEARQEEAYVTAALLQVAQAVVSSSDLNDTLETVVHLLPILVGIDVCVIYLWDAASHLFRPTQVAAENRRQEDAILSRPYDPDEPNLLQAIRQTGEIRMSPILDHATGYADWVLLPSQGSSDQPPTMRGDWLVGCPLLISNQVFGALVVHEQMASPTFWERRMEILQGIAQQISLAIQNDLLRQETVQSERMEREIALARQIQETFLPDTLPSLPRWELDMRWETAREVGGDFYDIFKLEENRLGLVIADVSDKGLPAALYMTVTRTLIRVSAARGSSPAEVLEEVNKLLINDSADSMFITVVYLIISLDTGEIAYANAGHNLPLLFRQKKGTLEQLPKGGTALGIIPELVLTNHALTMQPGDQLLLYTDGVTDSLAPSGESFGETRLLELVREYGKSRPHDLLEALDDALLDFRRGLAPFDDVTLLAVRREPGRRRAVTAQKTAPTTLPSLQPPAE